MRKFWIAAIIVILVIVLAVGVSAYRSKSSETKAAKPQPRQHYVAIGDSVAAGQGLATPSDTTACDRTDESYASQLAGNKNLELTSVACSGATVEAGVAGSQTVNGAVLPPELAAVSKDTNIVTVIIWVAAQLLKILRKMLFACKS